MYLCAITAYLYMGFRADSDTGRAALVEVCMRQGPALYLRHSDFDTLYACRS